ncbi:hypothetical protein ACSEP4_12740, partial [Pseudomonas aeruginosa]
MSIAIDPSVSAFLRSPHGLLIDGQVFDQSESAEWFALDSVIEG